MAKTIVLAAGLLLCVAIISGCSSPPDQEMKNAQDAVTQARDMGAEQYVPEQFRELADSLNSAMAAKQEQDSKFALFRSYDAAKTKFENVEKMAQQVDTAAAAERDKVQQQVMTIVDSVGTLVQQAQKALSRAPRGKGTKADIELMKNELNGLSASYEDARADISDGKFSAAKAKLDSVMEGTERIIDEIKAARGRH